MLSKPKLVILSGAGLSADSGIQTFRGSQGLWMDHSVDEVANGLTWKNNWDVVRKFYNARRSELASVQPNAMHRMIADWQTRYPTTILTQNIDDLLERAGCSNVVHLHGKLTEMRCEACGSVWDIGYGTMGEDDRCTHFKCNSLKGVRPNVVFFHEMAPMYREMYRALEALNVNDVVLVIGTSGVVLDIDGLLFNRPGRKILNNLEPTDLINDRYFNDAVYGRANDVAGYVNKLVTKYLG